MEPLSGADAASQSTAPSGNENRTAEYCQEANDRIRAYLLKTAPSFVDVHDLRAKGWESKKADEHFKKQRHTADEANDDTAKAFYGLMQKIAAEMEASTRALSGHATILDLCMAPGGFLVKTLDLNPASHALAFSLPTSEGGHKVLLPQRESFELKSLDITMLAEDMGVKDIPADHPDHEKFLRQTFDDEQSFDLVLCDGNVLRTQTRASYREKREIEKYRLLTVQLALGLQHVKPGGTMVVLLHKADVWDSVLIMSRFHTFSNLRLFKPQTAHKTRSSFYMVASNIQKDLPEVEAAINDWKRLWSLATFSGEQEFIQALLPNEEDVVRVLDEFGPWLVSLGTDIWATQAVALSKASYITGAPSKGRFCGKRGNWGNRGKRERF